jgi:preprotein translocase subunit SecA
MGAPTSWTVSDTLLERYRHMTGSPVEHDVRPYFDPLQAIDAIDVRGLTDDALRARAAALAGDPRLPETFAIAREAAARLLGLRPFDVQLAAAIAMHQRRLAQLATGEGKTLVAVFPAILHALGGGRVHIFTANDYLARRDCEWMAPLYRFFGLTPAYVAHDVDAAGRRRAYEADVTYVTAKEAGFDFLRDHTALDIAAIVHRGHDFAIVDEADFILIDEARVPLVVAGPAPAVAIDYRRTAAVARALSDGVDYDCDEYGRTVVLTERGFDRASGLLGLRLDDPAQHLWLSAMHVALHAQMLLRRDRDYVVRHGVVELVDEWTGRVAENRRWPHGIHPAVEAKEDVALSQEGRVLGSIPMQHFIREYRSLAGMTATASSSADEFLQFFGLRTVVFPPHRDCHRVDDDDAIFTHRAAKTAAIVAEVRRAHARGQPVLVGTASVHESEQLGATLRAAGVGCEVLNAKHDEREAQIVARAGARGAVTISTNMAGRGTDIRLGGPGTPDLPAKPEDTDAVAGAGGLYVIGTNRHESRRIDNQLRGRAGRQGDPGRSRFFIALDDDLIRRYGVVGLIPAPHRPSPREEPVDDPVVAREIARAQRIIEGQNFDIRRTLWRYSAVVDQQRRIVYAWRHDVLHGEAEGVCAERAAAAHTTLVGAVGPDAVADAERRITLHVLDHAWAEHLALIDEVREGIHLQRYGGREPISEFHRQIIHAFGPMLERVLDRTVEMFERLTVRDGAIDLAAAGLAGTTSTWTYLVDDNPFSTWTQSLMASRNLGVAAAGGFLAVLYAPLTIIVAATLYLRKWARRRR